jgi:hypothetical protein
MNISCTIDRYNCDLIYDKDKDNEQKTRLFIYIAKIDFLSIELCTEQSTQSF